MSGAASASASPSNGRFTAETKIEPRRSEEHTSELQSQSNLVCRLLLEKKKCQPLAAMAAQQRACCAVSRVSVFDEVPVGMPGRVSQNRCDNDHPEQERRETDHREAHDE